MNKKWNLKKELANFSEDISNLRTDLTNLIHMLTECSKSTAEEIKDNIITKGKNTLDTVQEKCKKKPLVTIGYAFGIGLLAGIVSNLLGRKK